MPSNPFATRFTAPGKVPYLAEADIYARLHEAWLRAGRAGAILGPHGCGKSTLLATLEDHWAREHEYRVTLIALHDGERTLPNTIWQGDYQENDLLIIDGYEQLGWHARWALHRLRRRTSCGLLVTAHETTHLPTLQRVEPNYSAFLAVVRQLLEPRNDPRQAEEFLTRHAAAAWQKAGGNARETLFRLYDCWEEETISHLSWGGTP